MRPHADVPALYSLGPGYRWAVAGVPAGLAVLRREGWSLALAHGETPLVAADRPARPRPYAYGDAAGFAGLVGLVRSRPWTAASGLPSRPSRRLVRPVV